MPRETLPITPSVLVWARERSGFSLEELKATFKTIEEWESGASAPTYPQLEQLADKLKLPVAVFFFPEPPRLPPLRESFRTLPDTEFDLMPPQIRQMLRKAKAMQLNLLELNDGKNAHPRRIDRDLSFSTNVSPATMARQVREYLGISTDRQLEWPDADAALEGWRRAIIAAGVFIFKDAFRSDDYSGFCLQDDEFPIIYVNNSMSKTRQIFTLFHELAHLLFRTSGIDTPSGDYVNRITAPNARALEVLCNKFAGALLLPDAAFRAESAGLPVSRETAVQLARRFNVSRDVVYRRFLDNGSINSSEYEGAVAEWRAQAQAASSGGGGGDYYNTQIAYLGTNYINMALSAFYQNRIDQAKLADYLNIAPRYVSALEERLARRRA